MVYIFCLKRNPLNHDGPLRDAVHRDTGVLLSASSMTIAQMTSASSIIQNRGNRRHFRQFEDSDLQCLPATFVNQQWAVTTTSPGSDAQGRADGAQGMNHCPSCGICPPHTPSDGICATPSARSFPNCMHILTSDRAGGCHSC